MNEELIFERFYFNFLFFLSFSKKKKFNFVY